MTKAPLFAAIVVEHVGVDVDITCTCTLCKTVECKIVSIQVTCVTTVNLGLRAPAARADSTGSSPPVEQRPLRHPRPPIVRRGDGVHATP